MRTRRSALAGAAAGLLVLGLAACGDEGSSGTQAPEAAGEGGCAPVAGEQLVVLEDDQNLQNTDNVIPAVNAEVADEGLLDALAVVSESLDTERLIELNRVVDVDRSTPSAAAEAYAQENDLTSGIEATGSGSLTVGAANFSESETLAHLYRVVLEAAGYDVTVQTIGNRELYEPSLESGEIDVVPEYAATMADFLNGKLNGADAEPVSSPDLDETVAALEQLGEQVGIVFGTPSQAQDQNAFAVTEAFAETYGVATLSELAEKCSGEETVLGGPPECPQRDKCQAGLEDVYDFQAGSFSSLDAGGPQTKAALRDGTISVGLVFSSDAALAQG